MTGEMDENPEPASNPAPAEYVERVGRVCHEANRAYCVGIGDTSQVSWDEAPDWQKNSALSGVEKILRGEITSPAQAHESWLKQKTDDGWVYGELKDADLKTHPCIRPYDELPADQKVKDAIFFGICYGIMGAQS